MVLLLRERELDANSAEKQISQEGCSDGMIQDINIMTNYEATEEGQGTGEEAYYIPIPWAGVGGPNTKS